MVYGIAQQGLAMTIAKSVATSILAKSLVTKSLAVGATKYYLKETSI